MKPFIKACVLVLILLSPALSQELEIHCIDVGQGSSELIIGPDGTTILIDGGGSGKGRTELKPYLDAIFPPGGRFIDYVICSHDHSDHYGGLKYILDNGYSAGTVYHCGYNSGLGRGTAIPIGTTIELGNDAVATCVLVNGLLYDGTNLGSGSGANSSSIAMLVEYGGFDYVTAGDLAGNREDDLAEMLVSYVHPAGDPYHPGETFLDPAHGVDVIHANHHGSASSTVTYYVNTLRCELAVFNGGTGYGHPRQDAVDRVLARQYYTSSCSSNFGKLTGVTAPAAEAYRTTAGGTDCTRAVEEDCPTAGDIVVVYDGGAGYSVEGSYLDIYYKDVDEGGGFPTPTPMPTATLTPEPPTPTSTPTMPGATPTPTPPTGVPGEVASTSFEQPAESDPMGYTLSSISGSVPDDPGLDEWGRSPLSPKSGSYSFAARDCSNEGRCTFNSIDINGRTGVVVRLWLSTNGNFEGGDYAKTYVVVDGAQQPPFLDLAGDELDDLSYGEYTFAVPDGASSIQVVYEVRDSANSEYIHLDDVKVTADAPTPTPTPFSFPLKVSFQPSTVSPPPGWLGTDESSFGAHGPVGWQ